MTSAGSIEGGAIMNAKRAAFRPESSRTGANPRPVAAALAGIGFAAALLAPAPDVVAAQPSRPCRRGTSVATGCMSRRHSRTTA